jgi:hypothetical protein
MNNVFNNRELALFAWIILFLIWVLARQSTRQSLFGILRIAFATRLSIIFLVMVLYVIAIAYGLFKLHLWDSSQLKNTVFWFFTVALVSFFDITSEKKNNYFKIAVKDIFNFTAILQFIVGVYSFNFFAELLLVPVVILIVGMIVVGEKEPKNAPVIKLLNNLLSLLGIFLIGFTIYCIVKNFYSFANKGTLSDFLIPATLSFMFLPLIYFLSLYVNHEDTFVTLDRTIKGRKLLWYAKWQTLIHFNFNKSDLRRWRSLISLRHMKTKEDIRNSISFIRELKKIEKNPPEVSFEKGWSPYKAKDFLVPLGINTRYYHPYFDDDGWSASSSYIDLKESKFLDTIAYYVDGDKNIVRKLKLVLNAHSIEGAEFSHERFLQYVQCLYQSAMNNVLPQTIKGAILKGKTIIMDEGNRKISVSMNKWQDHKRHGHNVDFSIEVET